MTKLRKVLLHPYTYFLFLLLPIFLTLFYGENLTVNIGNFHAYGNFGVGINPVFIFVMPILIMLLYSIPLLIAYYGEIKLTRFKSYFFVCVLGAIIFIYMIVLTITKDISYLLNPFFIIPDENYFPSLLERVYSSLALFLTFLMLVSFYYLFKPLKGYKKFFIGFFTAIVLVGVASIVYSLVTEFDKYKEIISKPIFLNKDYGSLPHSFYDILNVYGHVLYAGIISLVMISSLTNKRRYSLLSVLFVPFIYFSGCRAAVCATVFTYLMYIFGCYVVSFKKSKVRFAIYTLFLFIIVFLILFDIFVFNWIQIETNGKILTTYDILQYILQELFTDRIKLVEGLLSRATLNDILFGIGFGNQYVLCRTYGFIYYFHNTLVEMIMIGGLPFTIYMSILVLISFFRAFKMRKDNTVLVVMLFGILISTLIYGFSESLVPGIPNFAGGFYSFVFMAIPNMMYEEWINEGEMEIVPKETFKQFDPTFDGLYSEKIKVKKEKKTESIEDIYLENDDDFYISGVSTLKRASLKTQPVFVFSTNEVNDAKANVTIFYDVFSYEEEKYKNQILKLKDYYPYFLNLAKNNNIKNLKVKVLFGLKVKLFLNSHEEKSFIYFSKGYYIKDIDTLYISFDELSKINK